MTDREHSQKGTVRKRYRTLPSVELNIPRRRIDVDAWLGSFVEREVDREVHPLADKPVRQDDSRANTDRPASPMLDGPPHDER